MLYSATTTPFIIIYLHACVLQMLSDYGFDPFPNYTGAPLPPPQPSAPNPDYVQCPYCQRRFQEAAAERHIPFCKEQSSRIERKAPSTKAKDVYNKRMQV